MSDTKLAPVHDSTPVFRTRAQQVEKTPPCQLGCPNAGDVRGWIGMIAQHEKNGLSLDAACDNAWRILAERNPLPASISRICPHPCESGCTRADKDGAVSINALERFLGDWGISRDLPLPKADAGRYEESIGVIGSGPASLSFAYQMARRGYPVTMYEQHAVAGGMLRYAIPDYRLPREILDAEVRRLLEFDIDFVPDIEIGRDVSFDALSKCHDLLFLGLGAQAARGLGIPGENGPGVLSGIDYLRQRKETGKRFCGERVLVIGGGNTAMDAARSARREGAEVTVLYRRTETEMPAAAHEVEDARREGVAFRFLMAPRRILHAKGALRCVEVQAMQLGAADEDGRRRPEPVPGVLQEIRADTVIVAVAQAPDWQGLDAIEIAEQWLQGAADGRLGEGYWAGGDDRGPDIASRAIAQGRIAAESAHAELRGLDAPPLDLACAPVDPERVMTDYYAGSERGTVARRPEAEWLTEPDAEINQTISVEQAFAEASRCMSCGLCFDCRQCFMYCNRSGFTRIEQTAPGNYFALALDACEGCGKCIEICPCGYLEARDETCGAQPI